MFDTDKAKHTTLDDQAVALYALNPQRLTSTEKHRQKRRAILNASLGFFILLFAVLPVVLSGGIEMTTTDWLVGLAVTSGIWLFNYLFLLMRFDQFVSAFDPHFVVLPVIGAAFNIALFAYLAPDLRILVLCGWFTVILFGGALLTARQLFFLSLLMGLGYAAVILRLYAEGYPFDLIAELAKIIPFWVFWLYSGGVTDRIRARREENRLLRTRLAQLAFTDSLTGLDNRRAFEIKLDRRLESIATDGPLALLVFDLDHFKLINDERGHQAGDQVLCQVAQSLKQMIPQAISLARLGGDEFGAIINTESEEELRSALDIIWDDFNVSTSHQYTTSGGVIYCDQNVTSARCLRFADTALYEAKASGRDCYRLLSIEDISKALAKRHHD